MLNRVIRLALCSSLLFGAASATSATSATSARDIITRVNAQIAGNTTVNNSNNQYTVIRGNGTLDRGADRTRPRRGGGTSGTTAISNVSSGCTNGSCTVTVNGVTYGPFEGSNVSVSQSSVNGVSATEISVDGQVVLKL